MSRADTEATILEQRLRLGVGLHEADRPRILAALDSLNRHLEHWNPDQVDVHVGIKDRDGSEQTITLEVLLPHTAPLVAHYSDPELDRALVEARQIMARAIEASRTVR